MDTVWTERKAGEVASVALTGETEVGTVVVLDPNLSPDWVKLPGATPHGLGNVVARVIRSVWFPIGINPNVAPESGKSPWVDGRTRWHLVKPESNWDKDYPLALAEIPNAGWFVIDLGPHRTALILNWDESDG